MLYNVGISAIKSLVAAADGLSYYRARLSAELFKGEELPVFLFVDGHYQKYRTLPSTELLHAEHPVTAEQPCTEVPQYYVDMLVSRYSYETIKNGIANTQQMLMVDKFAADKALQELNTVRSKVFAQRHRTKILDFGADGKDLMLSSYQNTLMGSEVLAGFGWPYMDKMSGGMYPGDLVSIVGRPATGKSYFSLWTALHNWRERQKNTLFVSMEMTTGLIAQRIAAMYTHVPVKQLQTAGFSTYTFTQYATGLGKLQDEPAKFYVVDGNLAVGVDEIFQLAELLGCVFIEVDGAYLMRHPNPRLDRYTKVAENVEMMKRAATDTNSVAFASWQFNRTSVKNKKKGEKFELEDIGYSDAIGQASSIVLGLTQEESVETINCRTIDVLKGRSGEVGRFQANWNFTTMDFSQYHEDANQTLSFI